MFLELCAVVVGLVVLWVLYVGLWCQTHWRRTGAPTLSFTPVLGSLGPALMRKRTLKDVLLDLYNEGLNKNLKWGGIYMSSVPQAFILDPQLVREITVSHFDHFTDRQPFAKKNVDDLLAQSLLSLKGDEWRQMRHRISPAFTGSKLRGMSELMVQTGLQLGRYLKARSDPEGALDARNLFRRFAADVIATTAFGTPCNSLANPEEEFFKQGLKLSNFTDIKRQLVIFGYVMVPKLMAALKIPFLPSDLKNFFTKMITENIKFREQTGNTRPDVIQLLLEFRQNQASQQKIKDPRQVMSDNETLAQAFTFFLAGFEAVSTLIMFTCLTLGGQPEVQAKLRSEVDEAFAQVDDGKLSYETIQGMKYLDMVLSEVLRVVPVAAAGDRVCTKALDLPEFGFKIKKGTVCMIPFYAFQMDPQFYPDPEDFRPERFSEENRHKIKQFTYMPFGSGPRNCIGNRFALLEVKIAIAYLLAGCEVELDNKNQYPIQFDPKKMDNSIIGGFDLRLKLRDDSPIGTILAEK